MKKYFCPLIFAILSIYSCKKYGPVVDDFNFNAWEDAQSVLNRSDSLENIEKDTLIGNFIAGMSENEYNQEVNRIKENPSYTFLFDNALSDFTVAEDLTVFEDGKLKRIVLRSKHKSENWAYVKEGFTYERGFYAEGRTYYNVEKDEKEIIDTLSIRYGNTNGFTGWHFPYKCIEIHKQEDLTYDKQHDTDVCYYFLIYFYKPNRDSIIHEIKEANREWKESGGDLL